MVRFEICEDAARQLLCFFRNYSTTRSRLKNKLRAKMPFWKTVIEAARELKIDADSQCMFISECKCGVPFRGWCPLRPEQQSSRNLSIFCPKHIKLIEAGVDYLRAGISRANQAVKKTVLSELVIFNGTTSCRGMKQIEVPIGV